MAANRRRRRRLSILLKKKSGELGHHFASNLQFHTEKTEIEGTTTDHQRQERDPVASFIYRN